ncbi:hypothetical protein L228DRAFT_257511 [Xylona heveae TC161]|uniref:Uncharacterized protein n=1 Tax=Xylona heveae (strain CBS 132557 / TC161) TaxID=1328760 RepID=A0A165JBA5_XYLHT|nr:hypothetical protein L228DRAFT_257511 [Xylona heveae TC161]KZF26004.1 hypothetical protein L228DRAFT_257511 [Xylona heveae TC161]
MNMPAGGVKVCAPQPAGKHTSRKHAGGNQANGPQTGANQTGAKPVNSNKTLKPSYFNRFKGFVPNPKGSIRGEFRRLAWYMNWQPHTKEWYHHRYECYDAEFGRWYGTDTSRLDSWRSLCREVGHEGKEFTSITQCKKYLQTIHVNLIDLIDSRRKGTKVRVFQSYAALRAHTLKSGKKVPREMAKKDGFARVFLRFM